MMMMMMIMIVDDVMVQMKKKMMTLYYSNPTRVIIFSGKMHSKMFHPFTILRTIIVASIAHWEYPFIYVYGKS